MRCSIEKGAAYVDLCTSILLAMHGKGLPPPGLILDHWLLGNKLRLKVANENPLPLGWRSHPTGRRVSPHIWNLPVWKIRLGSDPTHKCFEMEKHAQGERLPVTQAAIADTRAAQRLWSVLPPEDNAHRWTSLPDVNAAQSAETYHGDLEERAKDPQDDWPGYANHEFYNLCNQGPAHTRNTCAKVLNREELPLAEVTDVGDAAVLLKLWSGAAGVELSCRWDDLPIPLAGELQTGARTPGKKLGAQNTRPAGAGLQTSAAARAPIRRRLRCSYCRGCAICAASASGADRSTSLSFLWKNVYSHARFFVPFSNTVRAASTITFGLPTGLVFKALSSWPGDDGFQC